MTMEPTCVSLRIQPERVAPWLPFSSKVSYVKDSLRQWTMVKCNASLSYLQFKTRYVVMLCYAIWLFLQEAIQRRAQRLNQVAGNGLMRLTTVPGQFGAGQFGVGQFGADN